VRFPDDPQGSIPFVFQRFDLHPAADAAANFRYEGLAPDGETLRPLGLPLEFSAGDGSVDARFILETAVWYTANRR
jgi:hypothetical protein